ncbi:MAG: GDP-L-fucose synthase family protein [Rhodospirillaceae bacterium]
MQRDSRIYVAGHRGLVGSAIVRELRSGGYTNLILRTHAELDLTNQAAVREFFEKERPEYVFLAAAKVGGILANNSYPAEFIHDNLAIQTNVIHEAWRSGVRRLLFLGSSCIYPRDCPQPIKEEYLLTGPLEPTNRPYALAKIAGIEMCWSYNRQYGTQYLAAMPTNLYGPGDNYDLQTSHVLPALIRKFHEAKSASPLTPHSSHQVTLWGTGNPRREFLYSDDLANACVYLMVLPESDFRRIAGEESQPPLVNVGCGEDQTIRELAEMVAQVVGYRGEVAWDTSKPDGTYRKLLDVSRLKAVGWRPEVSLVEGIRRAYADFSRECRDIDPRSAL